MSSTVEPSLDRHPIFVPDWPRIALVASVVALICGGSAFGWHALRSGEKPPGKMGLTSAPVPGVQAVQPKPAEAAALAQTSSQSARTPQARSQSVRFPQPLEQASDGDHVEAATADEVIQPRKVKTFKVRADGTMLDGSATGPRSTPSRQPTAAIPTFAVMAFPPSGNPTGHPTSE